MALRTDNLKTAQCLGFLVQLNIRTTASHVGGNGNRTVDTCICYDFGLQLMELGIQHFMGNSLFSQHLAQKLGSLNGNGTHQNRLSLLMCFLHLIHNCFVFFFLCLIYSILQVLTNHRPVGGDDDNVHGIDVAELFFLGLGSTCHTGLLGVLVEEVLECYGSQGTGLAAHIYMLLCLDCLMESVGITAAGHNTACKFIYDQDLVILYNIILIPEHQVVGTQSQDNVMLNLQVLRICQVFNMEVLLHLLDALFCQVDHFILFIHNEIAGLLNLFAHDGVNLGEFLGHSAPLQLAGQYIAHLIELSGFAALA